MENEKNIVTGQILTMENGEMYTVTGSVMKNGENIAHLINVEDQTKQKIVIVSDEDGKIALTEIDMKNESNKEKIIEMANLFSEDLTNFIENNLKEMK